jgi:hypothetical protein
MGRLELALDPGRNSGGCLRRGWAGWNWLWSWIWEGILEAACEEDGQAGIGSGAGSGKEFLRLPAERLDRLELALDPGRNSGGCLRRGWAGWNWLWSWIWEGIFEAACEEDGQAGIGSGAGSGKEFQRLPAERLGRLELALDPGRNSEGCLRRGWAGWNWLWSWIWEGILEAACGEDGQAGTGSGSGKEFWRLLAKRMGRLELALELDLGRNSRGCLRRGWTGWNWLWSWIWEGILEAACGEAGQVGIGFGSGKEF